ECEVDNGNCPYNSVCSHDAKTFATICSCKVGTTNTGSKHKLVCTDSCEVKNGECDANAMCSHDAATNAVKCTCKTGYANTGSNGHVTCTLTAGRCVANVNSKHVNTTSKTFQKGTCPVSSNGRYGWHFTTPDVSTLFVSIECQFKTAGRVTRMIQTPSTQHAYVYTPTHDTLLSATAVVHGSMKSFSLQHVCGD
ncbi:unnamed protein product, partial [Adineta steineri]